MPPSSEEASSTAEVDVTNEPEDKANEKKDSAVPIESTAAASKLDEETSNPALDDAREELQSRSSLNSRGGSRGGLSRVFGMLENGMGMEGMYPKVAAINQMSEIQGWRPGTPFSFATPTFRIPLTTSSAVPRPFTPVTTDPPRTTVSKRSAVLMPGRVKPAKPAKHSSTIPAPAASTTPIARLADPRANQQYKNATVVNHFFSLPGRPNTATSNHLVQERHRHQQRFFRTHPKKPSKSKLAKSQSMHLLGHAPRLNATTGTHISPPMPTPFKAIKPTRLSQCERTMVDLATIWQIDALPPSQGQGPHGGPQSAPGWHGHSLSAHKLSTLEPEQVARLATLSSRPESVSVKGRGPGGKKMEGVQAVGQNIFAVKYTKRAVERPFSSRQTLNVSRRARFEFMCDQLRKVQEPSGVNPPSVLETDTDLEAHKTAQQRLHSMWQQTSPRHGKPNKLHNSVQLHKDQAYTRAMAKMRVADKAMREQDLEDDALKALPIDEAGIPYVDDDVPNDANSGFFLTTSKWHSHTGLLDSHLDETAPNARQYHIEPPNADCGDGSTSHRTIRDSLRDKVRVRNPQGTNRSHLNPIMTDLGPVHRTEKQKTPEHMSHPEVRMFHPRSAVVRSDEYNPVWGITRNPPIIRYDELQFR